MMNKKQLLAAIKNSTSEYERERLRQLLHYMTVEGVDTTTTNSTRKHSTSKKFKRKWQMQSTILEYKKKITNDFGAVTQRTFYSVYNKDQKLVIHTSNKTLAMRTRDQLNASQTQNSHKKK